MKKSLSEQLERIHKLNYGKSVIKEGFVDDILKTVGLKKVDDPKKADLVGSDVEAFFNNLESIDEPIFQQSYGSMEYQKNVETVQMGLVLLGYNLPVHGIDGLFGPETAEAIEKFKVDNKVEDSKESINEATLDSPIPLKGVTSNFGVKRSYETHPGVDLSASSGTEIKSPADGKIIDAKFKAGACGGTIQIQHADGFTSRYCHCKDIRVSIGQQVKQGEIVGLTGGAKGDKGAGNSTGPHLHFELKKNGVLVNPMDYIGASVGQYDFSKTGVPNKSVISVDMVEVLINKLKEKGVTSEDLKKLVDSVVTGGGAEFTDLDLTNPEDFKKYQEICQKFIDTRKPNPLGITGGMMATGARLAFERYKRFVPAELALAQLAAEGGIGNSDTQSRPIRTKNPFNVGNTDSGDNITHNDVQNGINSYYLLIAKNYLGQGKTAKDLINNFVNKNGNRYASAANYERTLNVLAGKAHQIASTVV